MKNKQEKNNQHLFFHHDLCLHLNEKDQFSLQIYLHILSAVFMRGFRKVCFSIINNPLILPFLNFRHFNSFYAVLKN